MLQADLEQKKLELASLAVCDEDEKGEEGNDEQDDLEEEEAEDGAAELFEEDDMQDFED